MQYAKEVYRIQYIWESAEKNTDFFILSMHQTTTNSALNLFNIYHHDN